MCGLKTGIRRRGRGIEAAGNIEEGAHEAGRWARGGSCREPELPMQAALEGVAKHGEVLLVGDGGGLTESGGVG